MVSFTVLANLLMKVGSQDAPSPLFFGLLSWKSVWGLVAFGFAGLCYAAALRYLPLNVAQSFGAAQYIAVILAAKLILDEPVMFQRWVGISMIGLGIIVIAMTHDS